MDLETQNKMKADCHIGSHKPPVTRGEMTGEEFDSRMATGYEQAQQGISSSVHEVFQKLIESIP